MKLKKKNNGQQEKQSSFQVYTYVDGKVLTNLLETKYHSSLLAILNCFGTMSVCLQKEGFNNRLLTRHK